jgi:release factor glutamine methyltransferase
MEGVSYGISWARDEERLTLLDEGGLLYESMPADLAPRTVGVEQTTFGTRAQWRCPMVLVCRSAAKLLFESQIIARGILRKLTTMDLLESESIGSLGVGALGSQIARALLRQGVTVLASDIGRPPEDLRNLCVTPAELLAHCPVVLGCTGTDSLDPSELGVITGRRIFVSCSSNDIEFRSIAARLSRVSRFGPITGYIGTTECVVLNGGFPINFDRQREWEQDDEIRLTRRLVLEGLDQTERIPLHTPGKGLMLDPRRQLRVLTDWLERVSDPGSINVSIPLTEESLRRYSEGEWTAPEPRTYRLHETTPHAVASMRSHRSAYEYTLRGLSILVLPGVWSPAYDWSSLFYIENLPDVRGLDVLEVGCGTAVISIFLGRGDARRVESVDVNPVAVRNACLNFERYGLQSCKAYVSDGFSEVRGKFDLVVWNAPYHGTRPSDMLERGCSDENYQGIRRFFHEVGVHLRTGGRISFGFSESGDIPLLERLIADNGLRVVRRLSDWRDGYNCMIYDLVRKAYQS